MIVLYIFLIIILFLLLLFGLMLFIPLKTCIKGTYWDKKPAGQMDVYWIKYFLGSRVRIRDLEFLRIVIWFFGIPISLKFKLKKQAPEKSENDKETPKDKTQNPPIKIEDDEVEHERSINDRLREIIDIKDRIRDLWDKYKDYIKKIFVSYVTFSIEFIETEIGFEDPSQTGVAAGIVYSALSIRPLENIKVSWDYAKPNFNISSGIKMTMNLYGIFRTLLSLYFKYKKDIKNEIQ